MYTNFFQHLDLVENLDLDQSFVSKQISAGQKFRMVSQP